MPATRCFRTAVVFALALAAAPLAATSGPLTAATGGRQPIAFEPNLGQTDPAVRFLARGPGYSLFLTGGDEAVMALRGGEAAEAGAVLRLRLEGARRDAAVEGLDRLRGVSNYHRGEDPSTWVTGVPHFGQVRFAEVYPGVDLVYYSRDQELEYDFVVAPGADPTAIALSFAGADGVTLDAAGDLVLAIGDGRVVMPAPFTFQEIAGRRKVVPSSYRVDAGGRVTFELAAWDRSQELVIDPRLVYSSYLGGSETDIVNDVAVDGRGDIWVVGGTDSPDFPGTEDRPSFLGAFVSKIANDGSGVIFTTVIDGSGLDIANSIAIDGRGTAHVAGGTESLDFPVLGAFQDESRERRDFCLLRYCITVSPRGTINTAEAMMFRLDSDGRLLYSTYLGGKDPDQAFGVATDSNFNTYVVGSTMSENFPLQDEFRNNHRGDFEAFVTVFSQTGATLAYSTFLGGSENESAKGVAVLGRDAFVVGNTTSEDMETRAVSGTAFQTRFGGRNDGWVARLDVDKEGDGSLLYATYLGSAGTDLPRDVAVDIFGNAHVVGVTGSSTYPLAAPAGFPILDDSNDINEAFLTKVNPEGSDLLFSSLLGGSQTDEAIAVTLDEIGNAYLFGVTTSPDFPLVTAFQTEHAGGDDFFVAKIDLLESRLLFSTLLGGRGEETFRGVPRGGIALDFRGSIAIGGTTESFDFPLLDPFQSFYTGGDSEAFVARIDQSFGDTIGVFRAAEGSFFLRNSNTTGVADFTVPLGQTGDLPVTGDWTGMAFDRPGVFRAGTFILRPFGNGAGSTLVCCLQIFNFGLAGDLPVAGDWDGDGVDTVGIFRNGLWELRNSNSAGPADISFGFGSAGDLPVAGDWDGDGDDTIGVYRPSTGEFFLRFENSTGGADLSLVFGGKGDLPVVGDWNADGVTTIGVVRGSTFLLRNSNTTGAADLSFAFGAPGDLPIAGDWDGNP
jgi:hypothetical protein